jgi:hypothetical protein
MVGPPPGDLRRLPELLARSKVERASVSPTAGLPLTLAGSYDIANRLG